LRLRLLFFLLPFLLRQNLNGPFSSLSSFLIIWLPKQSLASGNLTSGLKIWFWGRITSSVFCPEYSSPISRRFYTLIYKSLSHNRWALQIFLSSDDFVTRGLEPSFGFFHAGDAQLCSRNKIFILNESWNYPWIWDSFIEFLVPSNLSFKITTLINPLSYIACHSYFSLSIQFSSYFCQVCQFYSITLMTSISHAM